ncbi:MAG: hypothetical protein ACLFP6_01910 [Spirochaetaceae bacterium]
MKRTLLLLPFLILFACVSPPEDERPDEPPVEEPPVEEPEEEERPEPEEQEPSDEDAPAEDTDEDFEVTEEIYDQTFDEVEQTISRLNTIIQQRDYEAWRDYLTDKYVEENSEPEALAEWSESPLLQRNDITLESLEDYFLYVVVPSRSNVRLDDLEFVDENTVEAYMNVRGRRALLYLLEEQDGTWKIDVP